MVIRDLYFESMAILPTKADAPLFVDPDAVLTLPIPLERLETVARWYTKVAE